MEIGFYQFNPVFGDISGNLDKIEKTLRDIRCDLLVLPELCTTGYQFVSREEVHSLAEQIPEGQTVNRLTDMAERYGIFLAAGIAEEKNGKLYNSAVITGPEGVLTTYRKIHLFFEETLWFSPGQDIPAIVEIKKARVAALICFDWLFPEIFRVIAGSGADIIVHPSNLILPYCQRAMQTRSIENRIFTVTANRIGTEERGGKDPLTFTGGSQVTDVYGTVLTSAPPDSEAVRTITIDPLKARDKTITPYNTLFGSRRPEMYQENVPKTFN